MPEPHEWPFEKRAKGSLRPWFFSAMGYLAVLFSDGAEAQHARRGLLEQGVPEDDVRLYSSEDVLSIVARLEEERSHLAKAVAALTIDRRASERHLDNARAGGATLWLFAPAEEDADRLVKLLADYDYSSVRYFGDDGVADVIRDAD